MGFPASSYSRLFRLQSSSLVTAMMSGKYRQKHSQGQEGRHVDGPAPPWRCR